MVNDTLNQEIQKIFPIHFVSYSSLNVFHSCARKLELDKLGEEKAKVSSPDFAFGSAVGAGIQSLLRGESLAKAWMQTFISWDCDIQKQDEKAKKSLAWALHAVKVFEAYSNVILQEWEIYEYAVEGTDSSGDVTINTKQATELSARVELLHGFVYRLYIDVVLRHKKTGQLLVLEIKTTKFSKIDEAQYKNSNQGLSYGVVLDKIAPGNASYLVWYYVYSSTAEDWEFFDFAKDRVAKADWIRTVLYDTGNIKQCLDADFFPRQGESCFSFFRQCEYFGSCHMSNKNLYAGQATLAKRVEDELAEPYDFRFTLEEIVDQQLDDVKVGVILSEEEDSDSAWSLNNES